MQKKYIITSVIFVIFLIILFFVKNGSTKYITKEITKDTITQYVEAPELSNQ